MAKRTSLKDIAQLVGVSTALVSYVLNNKRENRISKAVAQKIRKAAQELNYQPNQIAKSLKTNKTRTLGLLVADIANPFFSSLARYIEDEADRQGYTLIFASSDENPQKFRKLINTLLSRNVDGLLIAPPEGTQDQIIQLQQQATPFVLIDRYFPDLRTSYVALDNHQAIYLATEHLIRSGFRRIGMLTFQTELTHINERTRGYRSALNDHQIPFKKRWLREISRSNLIPEVAKAIHELTAGHNPVEAIVFASNTLALCGLRQLKSQSIRIPDNVAVVSFDETDINDLFHSPLTYVRQPLQEMGQLATRILLETMSANNRITQANLPATLVVQASTQPLAVSLLD
ncbi:LacI family DNA-binding transcriptional regulator [Spirosoma taeanense]|uniref:LacI family DNA-binding transcriptional regulator n=1 Tax=Spirosoma taeanense TaxID=2735870 RepID=A0A6M5Y6H4_9BACT|nr:LacI family DNA-binding transcriptional regulator [Spirosoma taeanense]QJW90017.1 LacI family DNA-binding transcriptional regulator [Spirosoma taeanense]